MNALREETINKFILWLQSKGIEYQRDVSISRISQIKAGGRFLAIVKPYTETLLFDVMDYLSKCLMPYKIIGNLSNILFPDGDIRTVAISSKGLTTIEIDADGFVQVGAGVMLPAMAKKLVDAGFKGFAGLIGIPATIGGAVFMNAGSYGDTISDYLERVRCVDLQGRVHDLDKSELAFSWRHSAFHDQLKGWAIVSVCFRLDKGDVDQERLRTDAVLRHRREYQESRYPNLGSTFATTDIYGDLARHFFGFRCGLLFLRLLLRFTSEDKHHVFAKWARWWAVTYFRLDSANHIDYSSSTINCIVNKGGAKADDLIAFVEKTDKAFKSSLKLEIELFKDIA